jgi:hypothetical protein
MAKAFEKDKPVRPVMVLLALETQQVSAEQPQNVLNALARSGAGLHVVSMEGGSAAVTNPSTMQDMAGRAQVIGVLALGAIDCVEVLAVGLRISVDVLRLALEVVGVLGVGLLDVVHVLAADRDVVRIVFERVGRGAAGGPGSSS